MNTVAEKPDWRQLAAGRGGRMLTQAEKDFDVDDQNDDDTPLASTPQDVVNRLGFDPLEELDDDDTVQAAGGFIEEEHPRVPAGEHGGGEFTPAVPQTPKAQDIEGRKELTHDELVSRLRTRVVGRAKMSEVEKAAMDVAVADGTRLYTPAAASAIARNVRFVKLQPLKDVQSSGVSGTENAVAFYAPDRRLLAMSRAEAGDFAHESAHAVDTLSSVRSTGKFSGRREWKDAWVKEAGNLWGYAKSGPAEGFAVAVQTAHIEGMDALGRQAPDMSKLLVKWRVLK
jgi:hypothetical protein